MRTLRISWRPFGRNSRSTWLGERAANIAISRNRTSQLITFRRMAGSIKSGAKAADRKTYKTFHKSYTLI